MGGVINSSIAPGWASSSSGPEESNPTCRNHAMPLSLHSRPWLAIIPISSPRSQETGKLNPTTPRHTMTVVACGTHVCAVGDVSPGNRVIAD